MAVGDVEEEVAHLELLVVIGGGHAVVTVGDALVRHVHRLHYEHHLLRVAFACR
jgi:hypothetical protein